MKPSDQDIQAFAGKIVAAENNPAGANLNSQDIQTIEYLLVTITSQAEIIARLNSILKIRNAFGDVAAATVASAGIDKLKAAYAGAQLNDFTFDDADARIKGVLQEIQQQNQLTQTFETVAKFAVKFAPLLLA
jgi:hypothetical protein